MDNNFEATLSATKTNVAKIDSASYDSLADAFDAATSGQTITLQKDQTLDSAIEIDSANTASDLTLDLNGFDITGRATTFFKSVNANTVFTICDNAASSVRASGTEPQYGILYNWEDYSSVVELNGGTLNFNSGELRAAKQKTTTANGATTLNNEGGGINSKGGTVNISGGLLLTASPYSIIIGSWGGAVNVSNGTISVGKTDKDKVMDFGTQIRGLDCTVNVSGGTITSRVAEENITEAIYNSTSSGGSSSIIISGGKILPYTKGVALMGSGSNKFEVTNGFINVKIPSFRKGEGYGLKTDNTNIEISGGTISDEYSPAGGDTVFLEGSTAKAIVTGAR